MDLCFFAQGPVTNSMSIWALTLDPLWHANESSILTSARSQFIRNVKFAHSFRLIYVPLRHELRGATYPSKKNKAFFVVKLSYFGILAEGITAKESPHSWRAYQCLEQAWAVLVCSVAISVKRNLHGKMMRKLGNAHVFFGGIVLCYSWMYKQKLWYLEYQHYQRDLLEQYGSI